MVVDKLRTTIATLEHLLEALPPDQQEHAADELATWLANQRFDAFLASPAGDAFLDELLTDARQAEREGTIIEGDWGD